MDKPKCKIIGKDGNIFNIIGLASRALRRNGIDPKAYQEEVMKAGSYGEALRITMKYVEVE